MQSIDLSGKSVIVTGAGNGIGLESALAFARAGASVVVNDIDKGMANATVKSIVDAGGTADAFVADVAQFVTHESMVQFACDTYGKLDIMFNNAGGSFPSPMMGMSEKEYRDCMAFNLDSVFFGTQAAAKVMMEQGGGSIISTSSGAGSGAVPGLAAYGAAKAGIISLMRSVAGELGKFNIRANAISPGAMDTPGLRSFLETLPGGVQGYNDAQPSGRLGRAEEIAKVAVFLASDHASFINGSLIPVDGAVMAMLATPL